MIQKVGEGQKMYFWDLFLYKIKKWDFFVVLCGCGDIHKKCHHNTPYPHLIPLVQRKNLILLKILNMQGLII